MRFHKLYERVPANRWTWRYSLNRTVCAHWDHSANLDNQRNTSEGRARLEWMIKPRKDGEIIGDLAYDNLRTTFNHGVHVDLDAASPTTWQSFSKVLRAE